MSLFYFFLKLNIVAAEIYEVLLAGTVVWQNKAQIKQNFKKHQITSRIQINKI